MKKVKFLQDFQGVETKGIFYRKGKEYELENDLADRMIYDGRAESVFVHVHIEATPQFEDASIPPHYSEQAESVYQPPAKKRGRK